MKKLSLQKRLNRMFEQRADNAAKSKYFHHPITQLDRGIKDQVATRDLKRIVKI